MPRLAGACFQVRVGTPLIVTVSISKRWPGAVRAWSISFNDIFGQAGSRAIRGSTDAAPDAGWVMASLHT